jgi:photosystem II stability/assembly factor-like uncharacterized protein
MSDSFIPTKRSLSRVWLIEGRARGDHTPSYESCLRMAGISQGFGDIEKIECPDPERYGGFVQVGEIQGEEERPTTTLEGRFALDLKSTLLRLARKRCAVDVQLHLGDCTDPRVFTDFRKIIIIEDAYLTNYSTEDMGSLSSGDDAAVNESADVSGKEVYEVVPLAFSEIAAAIITNEVLDVIFSDTQSCGGCLEESDGCQKFFALTKAAGGSPSTPADVVFSLDGGTTLYAHDVDSLGAAVEPNALDVVGSYLVVVSEADGALHYALKSEFDGVTDPDFTQVTTGFVGGPRAIKSVGRSAFIVGSNGYIYVTDDPTAGVDVLDAGSATADHLLAVDAISSTMAVAVGQNSSIVKTENGTSWSLITPPTGVGIHYNAVAVKSSTEFWIGTSGGELYATYDGGTTWTLQAFPSSGTGSVLDVGFATDSVMFLAHQTAATKGRILRSYNGGQEWTILPESEGTIPVSDRINSLGICKYDANLVVGGGLADNGTDGILVLGRGV